MRGISIAVVVAGLAASANAQFVQPISYSMPNGNGQASGGTFNYWDDTYNGAGSANVDGSPLSGGLGQLTDNIVGDSSWNADLGNGPAYEWVGWALVSPSIVFDYGTAQHLSRIDVHVNNLGFGSVSIFDTVRVGYSDDGVNFGNFQSITTSAADRADPSARFYALNLTEQAAYRYVRLDFTPTNLWLFISEIRAVPSPGALALLPVGVLALGRRRR
jgi:hypothetical protein